MTAAVCVAYPGRDGAHSAAASERLFPNGDLVPLPSFSAVAQAAAEGAVDFGVLPIESSLVGPIAETHDLLYDSPLSITGETVLPIRHCLAGPELVPLEEIRVVRSHPSALDQCRRLLAAMPLATAIATATTADAAAQVAARGDPAEAAITSARAAELHGLTLISGNVGDHPEAFRDQADRRGGVVQRHFAPPFAAAQSHQGHPGRHTLQPRGETPALLVAL